MKRWISWLGVLLWALSFPLIAVGKTTDDERKLGKETAEQIEKDKTTKFVTDPALLDRVDRIGKTVAAFGDEPDLTYTFKVIDQPVVNAFSLPGGYIYVYKGLIDRVDSDDELAGVMAHEMAHAAHHHMRQLLQKQKKMDWATLALLLAGAVSGADVSQAALFTQVLTQARVNGYGIKYEKEADLYAVDYLSNPKSPYSPVGVLTFMERLERDDALRGDSQVDMGIYQDHPLSQERVTYLIDDLNKKGIQIDRRKVMSSQQVTTKTGKLGDQTTGEVWVGKYKIASLAAENADTPIVRAQSVASRLDAAMNHKLSAQDIHLGIDGNSVWAGKALIYSASPSDAKLLGKTEAEVAKQVQGNLQSMLWKQFYNTIY